MNNSLQSDVGKLSKAPEPLLKRQTGEFSNRSEKLRGAFPSGCIVLDFSFVMCRVSMNGEQDTKLDALLMTFRVRVVSFVRICAIGC